MEDDEPKPSLLDRLSHWLHHDPETREDLIELLHLGLERNLLDADALTMMEGVLGVADMQVRDVMVPRAQMDVIDISEEPEQFIPLVIKTAHSRFPVVDDNRDNVIGILLAKDLLRFYAVKNLMCATCCALPYLFRNQNASTYCCANFAPTATTLPL